MRRRVIAGFAGIGCLSGVSWMVCALYRKEAPISLDSLRSSYAGSPITSAYLASIMSRQRTHQIVCVHVSLMWQQHRGKHDAKFLSYKKRYNESAAEKKLSKKNDRCRGVSCYSCTVALTAPGPAKISRTTREPHSAFPHASYVSLMNTKCIYNKCT